MAKSTEGTPRGDPLAMPMCALDTIPLTRATAESDFKAGMLMTPMLLGRCCGSERGRISSSCEALSLSTILNAAKSVLLVGAGA